MEPMPDSPSIDITIRRRDRTLDARSNEPITCGVPLPKGVAYDTSGWTCAAPDGSARPLQLRVLERWADRSIRWVLADTTATLAQGEVAATYRLSTAGTPPPLPVPACTITSGDDGQLVIDTGGGTVFRLSRQQSILLSDVHHRGTPVLDSVGSALRITDSEGRPLVVAWRQVVIAEAGAVRCVVRANGRAETADGRSLDLTAWLHFFAHHPVVRFRLAVTNPAAARHSGGFWELGDEASVLLSELSMRLALIGAPGAGIVQARLERGQALVECRERIEVLQESSGGDNWMSANHVNREGRVTARFKGYQATADGRRCDGLRASPVVSAQQDGRIVAVSIPQFWQNFPRALSATPQEVTVGFLPAGADCHEIQGGEQKTHECCLAFAADSVAGAPLDWTQSRLVAAPAIDWYARAAAVPYCQPASTPATEYQHLVNAAIEGPNSFEAKRERIDEYGWRHFGDIYGDHEAAFQDASEPPLASHYNNQYDAAAGFARQFMRTGDVRWWTQFDEQVQHVIDIDIYHTDRDKSAYNHGLFWHTVHYVDAGRSTHRTYPRANKSSGGGPSSEHNYATGLMLHYFMTGSDASREAAIQLARFVVDIDDGTKTVFRWLSRGPTGLASASGSPTYHGPGRGSGNSLNALMDGFRLTGDAIFMEKAEEIIRRCTHPDGSIDALDLFDTERRWFYTMYLQALGRYLDQKIECGALDSMYAYGRAVLLQFARWMAKHEYPYLSKPERLEFPTETWAAQDLRKSDVFDYAARHATAAERRQFEERAEYFFHESIATLRGLPMRTLARPVVLLLSHGYMREALQERPIEPAPLPSEGWERWAMPPAFVPQKVRARRRFQQLAAAAVIALVGSLIAILSAAG
jgi:hypothetical protein